MPKLSISPLFVIIAGASMTTIGCTFPDGEMQGIKPPDVVETSSTHHLALDPLTLTFTPPVGEASWRMEITDARTGRTWSGGGATDVARDPIYVESSPLDVHSLHLVLRHPGRPLTFDCTITLHEEAVVTFDVEARQPEESLDAFHFPPRMTTDLADGALLFADRSPGILLPQTNHHYNNQFLHTYGNVNALDLPWIGVLDRVDGDGMMIHFDTPENSGAFNTIDGKGRLWPQMAWMPSMGTFEYPRRGRFIFTDGGGHVAMAKLYREMADEKGKIVPLTERAAERPRVEWLLGAPYIWGRSSEQFARELHAHGLRRAVIKGRASADQMTAMKELGYLTSEYDSYTDIQEGEPGPQSDDIEKTALRLPNGAPMKGWRTHHGIQYYTRSHYFARDRAELYVPPILKRHPFTARFIDVSAAIQPFEDYAPGRTFGARQDLDYRRDLFRYFTDELGLVLGAEHAKGWTMPLIDYSEGNMSGSFWWESERPGQLLPFQSTEEMSDNYRNIAMNMEWRVPLWDLVYHDVVVSTWYWGDSNGYLYNILPEVSDLKDALNILHGTPAMMWANQLGYGWDRNRWRFLETYRLTGRWHERVGFDEMVDHRYLSGDRLVQETTFSSGARAIVNLSTESARVEIGDEEVILAPYGFHASAGNFQQWRVERDGLVETAVLDSDQASLETSRPTRLGPFEGRGLIDFYHVKDGRWHIIAEGEWSLLPGEIEAFAAAKPVALARIDDTGNPVEILLRAQPGEAIALPESSQPMLYALLPGIDEETPILLPPGGKLRPGQSVQVSAGTSGVVRYEIDGAEVTPRSPRFDAPIIPTRTTRIKVRAFDGETPLGDTVSGVYTPTRVLLESGVMRTHDEALHVQLDVEGARTLRILITDAGDGLDFDSAAIGEGHVVTAGGERVHLKDLEIIRYSESDSRDHSIDADDISIGGRVMDTAIRTHAFADFIFALDGEFQTFDAHLGIPDDTEGPGTITFIVEGEY